MTVFAFDRGGLSEHTALLLMQWFSSMLEDEAEYHRSQALFGQGR